MQFGKVECYRVGNSKALHREEIASNLVALLKCLCSEFTWFLVPPSAASCLQSPKSC